MGLQNAVVTRISDARVRTTHVSGMATDIGIELAHLLEHCRHRYPKAEAKRDWTKLRLHVRTVAAFLVGGMGGAAIYRLYGGVLLIICAPILTATAAPSIFRSWLAHRDTPQQSY